MSQASPTEQISEDDFAMLLAQLEAKQEEFLRALSAISKGKRQAEVGAIEDHLFRLLGIVTFWLSLPRPSRQAASEVRQALRTLRVEVRG